ITPTATVAAGGVSYQVPASVRSAATMMKDAASFVDLSFPPLAALKPLAMVRALTLGAVSFLLGITVGKPVINWLRNRGIGKHIRIDGPASHQIKTGTPTMGGLIFLIPLVVVITIFMDIMRFKSLLLPLGI